ncbi:iron ABC transporter permease [Paenibacillus antri]|uniref:Iron ABC transporter permease n=1 Tax=Paenibacillus antri TaxID=2582848 RepID=A0A5R9G7H1_9BACL|nr:iron ABC transporter permease [Paenibacillus antri]TLS52362.1 iron ABC transporter permease [Paenibacillus antri]
MGEGKNVSYAGNKTGVVLLTLAIALSGCFVLYIGFGKTPYSFVEVVRALFHVEADAGTRHVVWNLRLPRALIAVAAGAMLGTAGAMLQSILRNPLVEPGLMGSSAGAVLFAVLWLTFAAGSFAETVSLQLVALFGGVGATLLVLALNSRQSANRARFALIGVVTASILQSATSLLLLHRQQGLSSIFLWLFGSLNGRGWSSWSTLWPWALFGIGLALAYARKAEILQLGDDSAAGLGLAVNRTRFLMLAIASALTAASVSVVGAIGFIGLIGPHVAGWFVGRRPTALFPTSALFSALLLLASDWVGQSAAIRLPLPGMEHYVASLPVGAVTTLLGAPFFLYLLRRSL